MRTHITLNTCVHMPAGVCLYVCFQHVYLPAQLQQAESALTAAIGNRRQGLGEQHKPAARSNAHTHAHKTKKTPKQNTHIFFFFFLSLPAVRNNCISYLKRIRGFNCFKVFQSQPRVNKRKRSEGCVCQSVQLKALSKEERGAAGGWGV